MCTRLGEIIREEIKWLKKWEIVLLLVCIFGLLGYIFYVSITSIQRIYDAQANPISAISKKTFDNIPSTMIGIQFAGSVECVDLYCYIDDEEFKYCKVENRGHILLIVPLDTNGQFFQFGENGLELTIKLSNSSKITSDGQTCGDISDPLLHNPIQLQLMDPNFVDDLTDHGGFVLSLPPVNTFSWFNHYTISSSFTA